MLKNPSELAKSTGRREEIRRFKRNNKQLYQILSKLSDIALLATIRSKNSYPLSDFSSAVDKFELKLQLWKQLLLKTDIEISD